MVSLNLSPYVSAQENDIHKKTAEYTDHKQGWAETNIFFLYDKKHIFHTES